MDDKFDFDKFEMMDKRRAEEVYVPPSALKFNPNMKERFLSNGFYLKWIRFRDGTGALDSKNIRYRMHPQEGYTFVSPQELDEGELVYLGDIEQYAGSDVITNGDLALMKVRVERAEARRKHMGKVTKSRSDAIKQILDSNNIDSRESRSVVRTGKNAHFSQ
jgi:hypothetical protein